MAAQRSRTPLTWGRARITRLRRRMESTAGIAISTMGNQFTTISQTAMSPKAPATMAILVMEKMVKKVLNSR